MSRREPNRVSGFSWADEVEKEEEAQVEIHKKQKPNPFGSARPREVVLQEKGIDWRKLDHSLHTSPHHLKEKLLKEGNSAPPLPPPPPLRRPSLNGMSIHRCSDREQKLRDPPISPNPYQIAHNENIPPLLYPPKSFVSDSHGMYRPCETYIDRRREKEICNSEREMFHRGYETHDEHHSRRYIDAEMRDTHIDCRREKEIYNSEREMFHHGYETHDDQHNRRYFNAETSDYPMEVLCDVNNLRNPRTHEQERLIANSKFARRSSGYDSRNPRTREEEWPIADSNYTRSSYGYKFVGSPRESEKFEKGRDVFDRSVRENTQNGRERPKGFNSSRNDDFQGNFGRENIEFDEDRKWVRVSRRKRGIELGFANSHYHNKRR